FAIALYDSGALYLGRDRFGLKPLYFSSTANRFAFGSRLRSLLAAGDLSRAPDRRFVACFAGSHYRTFDNEPAQSPYAEIAQLPAATWLRVKNGHVETHTWWKLEDRGDSTESEATLAEKYRELLLDAVALRVAAHENPAFTPS